MRSAVAAYLSMMFEAPAGHGDVDSTAYEMILKSKGTVSDLVFNRRQTDIRQSDTELRKIAIHRAKVRFSVIRTRRA